MSPGDDDFTTAEALASGLMTPSPARVLERTSARAATGEPGTGHRQGRVPGRDWLPRGDRTMAAVAVIRREWVAGVFGVSAVFAAVTALTSFNAPERVWGTFAAVTYAGSAVTAAGVRRPVRGHVLAGGARRGGIAAGLVDRAGHGLSRGRAAARGRRGRPAGAWPHLPRRGAGEPGIAGAVALGSRGRAGARAGRGHEGDRLGRRGGGGRGVCRPPALGRRRPV